MNNIHLKAMTDAMYHEYFKEYQNDLNLYFDKAEYISYSYNKENVNKYIKRQKEKKRISLAIMLNDEIIGEIIIKNIEDKRYATLSIALKNDKYKNRGLGTTAELLAIDYIYSQLDIPVVYADTILTNLRSQHVLKKIGFIEINRDEKFIYYAKYRDTR